MFGLSVLQAVTSNNSCGDCAESTPGLTVLQAYTIDKKIDDGFPVTGRVMALYNDSDTFGNLATGYAPNAATASSATCYDTTTRNYSISISNGVNVNCALSFKFQQ